MTRIFVPFLLAASLVLFSSPQGKVQQSDVFPGAAGTYWTYRGLVRWTRENSNQVGQSNITWKMEIRQVIPRPDLTALVIRGFPADLDWSDGTATSKDSLIIQTVDNRVYWIGPENSVAAVKRLQNAEDKLDGVLTDDDLLLRLPLKEGNKFCDPESAAREDGMYCRVVDASRVASFDTVKGAPNGPHAVFTLAYRTNPDDEEFDFAPGIGITSYEYHHHGTVADTELKLIEMHSGPAE